MYAFTTGHHFYAGVSYIYIYIYISRGDERRGVAIVTEASAGSEEERNAMADEAMKTVRNMSVFNKTQKLVIFNTFNMNRDLLYDGVW